MIEDGDHIMCCVSGGKDSATMIYLLCALQKQLRSAGTDFKITAVHLNQMQPGYNGEPLVRWLEELVADDILDGYKIITEDTYSVVIDKTPENKVYCSMCSRLRRGILYTVAHDIGANKIALGHHGDDAIQTLLLNFIHAGQMKAMPARYYSTERNIHVIRPLMGSLERDIASFAGAKKFPILPCNLCGTQPDAQRAKVKMLLDAVEALSPDAKKNMMNAMGDIRPSHLLDIGLREACGMDGATGRVVDPKRASLVKGFQESDPNDDESNDVLSQSRIEKLL
jgi:Predicted ATPase of the PP-loop superfamily implicated in cell cycle control